LINLNDLKDVKALKSNLRACLEVPAGSKEVMSFLEQLCGWYDFQDTDTNTILIKQGKRQVLATIKTLLKLTPEQIVALNSNV